jgi:ABC-type uncharacterized transport system substrate-binding protein
MAMKRIVAVAVGVPGTYQIDKREDLSDTGTKKVRRYLHGLVSGLNRRGYKLGSDVIIDFHLANETGLTDPATFQDRNAENPDVIFCMSTKVVNATRTLGLMVPIVGIVSDPVMDGFNIDPYCGVSAQRTQTAGDCFNNFRRAVPDLQRIYILGDNTNPVSQRARADITLKAGGFPITDINVTAANLANISQTLTNNLPFRDITVANPAACTNGLLVLPLDMFLGRANRIIDVVQDGQHLAAFFPVPDFVRGNDKSAIGAYGVPQKRCGVLMAEQVHYIFSHNGQLPQNQDRWLFVKEYDFELSTSAPAADKYKIKLGEDIPAPEE